MRQMTTRRPTSPMPRPDSSGTLLIELAEWELVGPAQDERLKGISFADHLPARHLAHALRNRVDIREGYPGLEISATSFVGRVDVGPLRIAIRPKLPSMPLARLLRYAYGLRDITTLEETDAQNTPHGFQDLLIAMLAAEVEELLHRGLARRYVPLTESLESPRGRILVNELARQGGITDARLPCQYFERRTNWQLNQVLRTGLGAAGQMTEDRDLRRRVHRLAGAFGDVEQKPKIVISDIDRAERGLNRITAANAPALTIIRLLHEMLGLGFEPEGESVRMPGFLFDMNRFFQRLVSRFLSEYLIGQRIVDEWPINNVFAYAPKANPRRRVAPSPRPDFALIQGNALRGFLDAKYRDIWEHGLPAEWLYQLSIYALAARTGASVLLYASMADEASDEQVDIRGAFAGSTKDSASVILRPVPLTRLHELLDPDRAHRLASERRRWAEDLVALRAREPASVQAA
jgi:5-methylcytosine-specific restriction enzyme subunit McrC